MSNPPNRKAPSVPPAKVHILNQPPTRPPPTQVIQQTSPKLPVNVPSVLASPSAHSAVRSDSFGRTESDSDLMEVLKSRAFQVRSCPPAFVGDSSVSHCLAIISNPNCKAVDLVNFAGACAAGVESETWILEFCNARGLDAFVILMARNDRNIVAEAVKCLAQLTCHMLAVVSAATTPGLLDALLSIYSSNNANIDTNTNILQILTRICLSETDSYTLIKRAIDQNYRLTQVRFFSTLLQQAKPDSHSTSKLEFQLFVCCFIHAFLHATSVEN